MMALKKNDFDQGCDSSFFENLLSFLNEPDDSDAISSGYSTGSSCSAEYLNLNEYSTDNFVATSGYFSSFSCKRFEPSYRHTKISKTLNMSWTESSTGLRVSSYERKPFPSTGIPAYTSPLPVFPRNLPTTSTATTSLTSVEDKQTFFRKSLKNVLLPELNNHPQRLRVLKETNDRTVRQSPNKLLSQIQMEMCSQKFFGPMHPIDSKTKLVCRFCLKNGEPDFVYTSHFLKFPNGIINCPVLKRYICDLCGATGDYAHTRKYCPRYEEVMAQMEYKLSLWGYATQNKL